MKTITQPRTGKVFFIDYDDNNNGALYESKMLNGKWIPVKNPIAIYDIDCDKTYSITTGKSQALYGSGDMLQRVILVGHYYVYALIDPKDKKPFYIGKGTVNRLNEHFQVGIAGNEIIDSEEWELTSEKNNTIKNLLSEGYQKSDIARVLVREVDENTAFAIEALLIQYQYGLDNLTNIQPGHYKENFRPRDNWQYLPSFDLPIDQDGNFFSKSTQVKEKHYVYVLKNPETNEVFYVGKGSNDRIQQHFNDTKNGDFTVDKIKLLDKLLKKYQPKDIGRIIAWVKDASTAYFLESFHMRFISDTKDLTNATSGHHLFRFRAKGDWKLRNGFDLPIIISPGAKRIELLDLFIGDGLDELLKDVEDEIKELIPEYGLKFGSPYVKGAGELVIEALVDNKIPLIVSTRFAKRFQIILWCNKKSQKEWMTEHFRNLNIRMRRKDNLFFPTAWKGVANMTSDPKEAALRVKKVVDLVRIQSICELDSRDDLREILE